MNQREIMRGVTERRTRKDIKVLRVRYEADPDRDPAINPQWKERERKKYSSEGVWQREQEVVHEAGGGERLFADILQQWGHKIIIDPDESGFQESPHWDGVNGFDVGKANPTAALVTKVDHDGVIYVLREYYQPGLSPKQHKPNLMALSGFLSNNAMADPSIFYATQAQADGTFKAIADLYREEGIRNLCPAPENNELLGMERILSHWMNLDDREPTLKIVCPQKWLDIAKPIYGIHNEGCPNLLWELRRARREQLTATQLVRRNPTEKIVDKDNHLRDVLKYIALSLPEPTQRTAHELAMEAIAHIPLEDITSRAARYEEAMYTQQRMDDPVPMSKTAQRRMARRRR